MALSKPPAIMREVLIYVFHLSERANSSHSVLLPDGGWPIPGLVAI
jgi:hypothetical protein